MSEVKSWVWLRLDSRKNQYRTHSWSLICSLVASICYFTLLWRESNFESDLTGALQCIMLRPPWRTALDWNTFTSFLIYLSYCYRYVSCGKFYLAWSRRSVSKRKRRDGSGRSRTREVWDDLTHTSHFLTPPLLQRCLLSRFVLLTESLGQAKFYLEM